MIHWIFSLQVLGSTTRYPSEVVSEFDQPEGEFAGAAIDAFYIHNTQTWDWYAQDLDGNVWYLGEEVVNYEYDDEGNVIREWSPHGAAKALELIARLRGDMIERRQVDVRTVAITINDVEMEDLR